VAAALFAASGPATPSIAPLPNSSGCLVSLRSVAYERKVGISEPPAGMVPKGKPIAVARSHAGQERFLNALGRADLFVHQGVWRGPYAERAHIVLPATSHAEQVGTFINCDGLAQTVTQAYAPHGSSLADSLTALAPGQRAERPQPFDLFALRGLQPFAAGAQFADLDHSPGAQLQPGARFQVLMLAALIGRRSDMHHRLAPPMKFTPA